MTQPFIAHQRERQASESECGSVDLEGLVWCPGWDYGHVEQSYGSGGDGELSVESKGESHTLFITGFLKRVWPLCVYVTLFLFVGGGFGFFEIFLSFVNFVNVPLFGWLGGANDG